MKGCTHIATGQTRRNVSSGLKCVEITDLLSFLLLKTSPPVDSRGLFLSFMVGIRGSNERLQSCVVVRLQRAGGHLCCDCDYIISHVFSLLPY